MGGQSLTPVLFNRLLRLAIRAVAELTDAFCDTYM